MFTLVFLLCIGYPSILSETPQYVKVGCFNDEIPRALPKLLKSFRGNIDWDNLQKIVDDCASETKKMNYTCFGIQFYGECWSGKNACTTYGQYGASLDCHRDPYLGKHWTNFVYRLTEKDPECLNYSNLTSERRSSSFRLPTDDTASCDNKLPPGWYRFLPPAGVQMATSPPPQGMCATPVTSWLSSEHPQVTDGIVNGTVCFRWGDNMCMWSQVIQVRNCSGFYVYKLQPTKYCPLHFCGQD